MIKIFEDISELVTLQGAAAKQGRRVKDEDLSIIKDAAIVSDNGTITWVGPRKDLPKQSDAKHVSLNKRTVMPAFIEPHTHLVFAGDRAQEFEWRMQGQTYQEISAKGGGILSTVKATRAASEAELLKLAQTRANTFAKQGVTLLEVKSGYGLSTESETKILKVARQIKGPEIVTTYLGPHSRSPDHQDLDSYMNEICENTLPLIAKEKLADRVDIYIEKGFYTLEQARKFFAAAQKYKLPITAHTEQLSEFGGTDATLEFNPQSVDHVVYINDATINKLSQLDTTAVLLPASDFYLKMRYPPARELIDQGARVALSTDFNPGTSPTQDLSLVGVLARVEMKMSLSEVIAATTIGAAHALGRNASHGSIETKKQCDFISLDCSLSELFYSVGRHPIHQVIRKGDPLQILKEN